MPAFCNARVCPQPFAAAAAVTPNGTVVTADPKGLVARADQTFYRISDESARALASLRDNALIAETRDGVVEISWPEP